MNSNAKSLKVLNEFSEHLEYGAWDEKASDAVKTASALRVQFPEATIHCQNIRGKFKTYVRIPRVIEETATKNRQLELEFD